MGISIVQKSNLDHPKANPKLALVLAGGAVTGGAFKLGGLKAFSRFMVNRRFNNFDIFVGVSAGSIIAAFLANAIPIGQIIRSLEGKKGMLAPMRAAELYFPNYQDFTINPLAALIRMLSFPSQSAFDFVWANNIFRRKFRQLMLRAAFAPNYENMEQFAAYCLRQVSLAIRRRKPQWRVIPNGIFSTEKFERSMRKNLEQTGWGNNFKRLYEQTGKELYIVAMNLDCATRAIFGHKQGTDQINTIPISQAVQASIAMPLFYAPVTIQGTDYIDGAIIKTTSIDLAIARGADLIICYNPFRPVNCESFQNTCANLSNSSNITNNGINAIMNQALRTLLHTRLIHGMNLYRQNPDFKGDIILIEPGEADEKFFNMNPLSFWDRKKAYLHGFESVMLSVGHKYDQLKRILGAHGIETNSNFDKRNAYFSDYKKG